MFRLILPLIFLFFATAGAWGMVPSAVNHPQGLLWHLVESGRSQEADQLETYLTKVLSQGELTKLSPLRVAPRTSSSYIAEFPNNIFAVLKEADPLIATGPLREVATYRISRMMGLNIVPLTVARVIDGKTYSLQLYYPPVAPNISEAQAGDIKAFDILIDNIDRIIKDGTEPHNVIQGRDGRIVAIDHSWALTGTSRIEWQKYQVSPEFSHGLARLAKFDLLRQLGEFISADETGSLQARLAMLQNVYVPAQGSTESRAPSLKKPLGQFSFEKPPELFDRDFYDVLAVTNQLRQGSRASLESAQLQLIEKHWRLATGVILQDWFTFEPPMRAKLLKMLWGGHFQVLAKNDEKIIQDIKRMDPMKAYMLNQSLAMGAVLKAMAPSAAAVIQCSQVFAH